MKFTKATLDTPINVIDTTADNPETPRQFIQFTEKEFDMQPFDLENCTDEQLNKHIEFLDYLWTK